VQYSSSANSTLVFSWFDLVADDVGGGAAAVSDAVVVVVVVAAVNNDDDILGLVPAFSFSCGFL